MSEVNGASVLTRPPSDDVMSFDAVDVTGTHEARVTDVQRTLPAEAVARAVAQSVETSQTSH